MVSKRPSIRKAMRLKITQELCETERLTPSRRIGLADLVKDFAVVLDREEPDGFCGDKHQPADVDRSARDEFLLLPHDSNRCPVAERDTESGDRKSNDGPSKVKHLCFVEPVGELLNLSLDV